MQRLNIGIVRDKLSGSIYWLIFFFDYIAFIDIKKPTDLLHQIHGFIKLTMKHNVNYIFISNLTFSAFSLHPFYNIIKLKSAGDLHISHLISQKIHASYFDNY